MNTNPPPALVHVPVAFGQTRPAHLGLATWIDECAQLCQPENIFYCDGSDTEREYLETEACRMGVLLALDPDKLPGCHYARSATNDVARVEHLTFICTPERADAGPTNNWAEPGETRAKIRALLDGAMRGRTMFVVPYLMGPAGSPLARVGVEITDSIYVALNMRIMSRMGNVALEALGADGSFNRGLHSVLDLNPERRFICHFPQDNEILSVGSGYGGNALLGKKCFALRIAQPSRADGRLDGRAHAHLVRGIPDGREALPRCRVPERLRQNQFRHAHPARLLPRGRVEDHHHRRRHRLDAARARTAASGRSTRKPGISASHPGPHTRRTPTR